MVEKQPNLSNSLLQQVHGSNAGEKTTFVRQEPGRGNKLGEAMRISQQQRQQLHKFIYV